MTLSQGKAIFIWGTAISAMIFLVLTYDSLVQMPKRTQEAKLDAHALLRGRGLGLCPYAPSDQPVDPRHADHCISRALRVLRRVCYAQPDVNIFRYAADKRPQEFQTVAGNQVLLVHVFIYGADGTFSCNRRDRSDIFPEDTRYGLPYNAGIHEALV